ncbi:MAG: hypothetical protein KGZ94_09200 [Clostridia bacterium]|nr:hypothetical protein [Clostridia bacterium]
MKNKKGYGDLAIMSIETYAREMALADAYKKLAVAENQIKNGELFDGDEVKINSFCETNLIKHYRRILKEYIEYFLKRKLIC